MNEQQAQILIDSPIIQHPIRTIAAGILLAQIACGVFFGAIWLVIILLMGKT